MSDKVSHRVFVNVLRPKLLDQELLSDVKIKTRGKSIRKPSDVSLEKYTLPNDSLLQIKVFDKDDNLLLPYRLYAKKQKSVHCKQRLGIRLDNKYKIISTDLRKRLYIEDPPDDTRAVTNIDGGFFQYLHDHPPLSYIPLYKSLKCIFHNHLRMKQEVGYRRDCVWNIELIYRKELETYECSLKKYMKQVKQFDAFVAEDYHKSMECLKKSEQIRVKVEEKNWELEYLANTQFGVQSRLIALEFMYYRQQKYGRFLYYLSPPSWRASHRDFARSVEIQAKGFDLGASSEEDTFNAIFEKMQNEINAGLVKPVLHFSHPKVLMDLFESMEMQQLHHFTHVNHLVPYIKMLKQNVINLKTDLDQDISSVVQTINEFGNYLNSFEGRKNQLIAVFMKILHGLFYNSVAGADVLKLDMHLEFCYEKIYAEKPANVNIVWTAKALEHMYMTYSFKLDSISNDNITRAMKQSIENEKLKMRRATLASRELRQFDRLEKAMLRSYKKGNANKGKDDIAPVKTQLSRLKSYIPKTIVDKGSSRNLTDAEVEYLTIFTDWTEKDNPADYLQSV